MNWAPTTQPAFLGSQHPRLPPTAETSAIWHRQQVESLQHRFEQEMFEQQRMMTLQQEEATAQMQQQAELHVEFQAHHHQVRLQEQENHMMETMEARAMQYAEAQQAVQNTPAEHRLRH